jgi:hypothetical protein
MSLRKYVCNRFPNIKIGLAASFQNGYFETDDPEVQRLIETSSSFGVVITFQDQAAIESAAKAANDAKMQGGYRTEESHNVARQVADKIGLDGQATEEMVKAREQIAAQFREAALQKKRGRPPKVKEQEIHG